MKRRQQIVETLGDMSKHGGDRKSPEYKEKNQNETVSSCFSGDTAQKIGLTPRSIQFLVQISNDIPHNLKAEIRDTFLAFELRNLIKLARIKDDKQQRAAALAYISGEVDTIVVPKKRGPTKTRRQQSAEEFAELLMELRPEVWPQVCTHLQIAKATVELSAFRKLWKENEPSVRWALSQFVEGESFETTAEAKQWAKSEGKKHGIEW